MTALTQYARLESTGLWRPDPEAQRRDVIVSFGEATLVMADGSGRPLSHWSLPAIIRMNPGERPAIFSPDEDGTETLEVSDGDMIDALEKVRRTISRSRPHPWRLRLLGGGATVAAVVALGVFWLPGALVSQTLTAIPPVKRSEIGATLLGHIQRLTGASCRSPGGLRALETLRARVLGPDAGGQLVVLPTAAFDTLYLPGGIIAISRTLVEDYEDPAVVAGHVLATAAQVEISDPLEQVLDDAGLGATFRLFTTGNIPADHLAEQAETILSEPGPEVPDSVLIPAFAAAELSTQPYAYSLDMSGETVLGLIEADPMANEEQPIVLRDADWVALQGICAS